MNCILEENLTCWRVCQHTVVESWNHLDQSIRHSSILPSDIFTCDSLLVLKRKVLILSTVIFQSTKDRINSWPPVVELWCEIKLCFHYFVWSLLFTNVYTDVIITLSVAINIFILGKSAISLSHFAAIFMQIDALFLQIHENLWVGVFFWTLYKEFLLSDITNFSCPISPSNSIWPHLSYGLVRSKREYCHNCSLVVVLCSFL